MNEQTSTALQAWKLTLSKDELVEVNRLSDLAPSLAVAYLAVEFRREIEDLRRPFWRQALAPVAAFGAVLAALLTPEVPRP